MYPVAACPKCKRGRVAPDGKSHSRRNLIFVCPDCNHEWTESNPHPIPGDPVVAHSTVTPDAFWQLNPETNEVWFYSSNRTYTNHGDFVDWLHAATYGAKYKCKLTPACVKLDT